MAGKPKKTTKYLFSDTIITHSGSKDQVYIHFYHTRNYKSFFYGLGIIREGSSHKGDRNWDTKQIGPFPYFADAADSALDRAYKLLEF